MICANFVSTISPIMAVPKLPRVSMGFILRHILMNGLVVFNRDINDFVVFM